ncbi:MAG TPA: hypothetical protein VFX49_21550 [Chloroflexota bacterium]|nr:hypothetical protein [Chloroflexota bacterium]
MAAGDLYVGLARARAVVVLDTTTDLERRRISLAALGQQNIPSRITVGAAGNAAVVPLIDRQLRVGVIGGRRDRAPDARRAIPGRGPSAEDCAPLSVGAGWPTGRNGGSEVADTLAADGQGHAYVLVGDAGFSQPSYAAVIDLPRSALLRHLPLAPAGETVIALAGESRGERLFASIWAWDETATQTGRAAGRLVALDTALGTPLVQASLASDAVVTDVTVAAPPPGAPWTVGTVVYAVVGHPGPNSREDDWWSPHMRFSLAAFDVPHLDPLGWWPLDERPRAVAVTPDGRCAYLFNAGRGLSGALACLDLARGFVTHRWELPAGCVGPALSPLGKAYMADPFGDRLLRFDTYSNRILEALPLQGAPIALAVG